MTEPTLTPPSIDPSAPAEDPRVEQALEEYLAALEAGEVPDRSRLQARYPDVADKLGNYLEGLEFLHRAAGKLQSSTCGLPAKHAAPPGSGASPPLEDYQIVREVGRGGMGIVYEAVQRSLHRRVALKVLPLGATLDPRHLQRFKNEAQAAAQLQHPHIVPVFAVGCEQGVHYYAMRFIEGQPLSELIRGWGTHGRPADPQGFFRQTAWIGMQAAEALDYAHQMGVIHRDVKPANLLLDAQGQVWVADFGLAHWSADTALTRTGDLLGTLRYMSPEQASARRGLVDHRTDVYSLGATLYELLTLRPVCPGADQRELLQQILNEDPVPPRRCCRDMPHDLETILLKALGKQAEERYATAQELADDLRRFLDGKPVLARRPAWWDRAGKWARRHRPLVGAAAVVCVLGVVGLAAGTVVIGREQAKAQLAYEQEAQARQTEAEARAREVKAREQAEQNFQQARRLVDYIADIAALDMASESDLPNVRRKMLEAALAYYKDFIRQQDGNQLTREELLRGHTRVATLLEAVGRPRDAQIVWNQVNQLALTFGKGDAVFHLVPSHSRLRLLRLAPVQQELKLSPQQVRTLLELESKRTERGRGQAVEEEAVAQLNPEQDRRLSQLLLQQLGVWDLREVRVIMALDLTPEQRTALAAVINERQGMPRAPGSDRERDRKDSLDRALKLLTAEQQVRWQGLVGQPFPGVLPPGDLVLVLGKMTIEVVPGTGAEAQGKARLGRPGMPDTGAASGRISGNGPP